MKQVNVKIGNVATTITVVNSKSKHDVLTPSDIEMDKLAEAAVKTAIKKAKICNKPIAKYNPESDLVVIQ